MILSGCLKRWGTKTFLLYIKKKTLVKFTFTAIHYLPHIYPHKPLSIKHIKLYEIIKYRQPLFPHSAPHKNFLYTRCKKNVSCLLCWVYSAEKCVGFAL